jgi:hypothetical protein
MYRTGTWSAPVLRSLLPHDAVILPPHSVYAVKPSEVSNVYDLEVRTCANGSKMIEGVHYDQYFAPVSSIKSIRMMSPSVLLNARLIIRWIFQTLFKRPLYFKPASVHTIRYRRSLPTTLVFDGQITLIYLV